MKKWWFIFGGALIGLAGLAFRSFLWHGFKGVPALEDLPKKDFLIIAHRGSSAHAPENTIAAFSAALGHQADMIEFDLHLSADGVPVVLHDATLERTTNGQGAVAAKNLSELKSLDAGSWFGQEFEAEPMPTLAEALTAIDGKCTALIELKNDMVNRPYPGLVEKVIADIRALNAEKWCIVQAFDPIYLVQMASLAPDIAIHQLLIGDLSPLPFYADVAFRPGYFKALPKVQAVNPYFKTLTPGKVQYLQALGYQVFPYTVNQPDDLKRVLFMGVDGIITNYPDVLSGIRQQRSH